MTVKRGMAIVLALAGVSGGTALATGNQSTFATSFEPGQPRPAALGSAASFGVSVGDGPTKAHVLTAKPEVGFTGLHALHYQGASAGSQSRRLFQIDLPVSDTTQLSYLIFPQRVAGDLGNPSNYVAVNLVFDDGSRLSTRGARDQHRVPISAQGQGWGRVLYPDQWNRIAVDLG